MNASFPDQATVVIVGGGIVGCSTAYNLAIRGCRDVVLLEKHKLTSGSTWHAAGAVGQLRTSANVSWLLGRSVEIYSRLEEETGQATGWHQNGSLRLATNADRRAEYERAVTTARSYGLEMEIVSPAEAKELFPLLDVGDLVCAAYVPSDGMASPSDAAMALAAGARMNGVRLIEDTRVIGFETSGGAVDGVITDKGTIRCQYVVNCAGIWSREIGRLAGVNVPIQPAYHQYMVTERIEGLTRDHPTIRDPDKLTYFLEIGGLAVGGYERNPKPYRTRPIPDGHEFKLMPEDLDHFEQLMIPAMERVPALETVGVRQWFNGIESFTEDGMFILGEAPELRRFFVGTGFNAFGIASAGGAGLALAEWILEGQPPVDLWAADIRRFGAYHGSDDQVRARALEGQSHHFTIRWPHEEMEACRPLRLSPIHHKLASRGACFGTKFGWERPNWFAPPGVEASDRVSFGRANWFPQVGEEHAACREAAALFDQSFFAKFLMVGRDAEAVLQTICAGDVGKPRGRLTYTQMLNPRGGIECDLTVSRFSDDEFYIVTGTGYATHDFAHIRRHIPAEARAQLIDVTSAYGTLSLMGPEARTVLAGIVEGEIDNESFPFGHCREIFVAGALVRALRVTFVGELGWELHVPSEYMCTVYDALCESGSASGLRDAGYRAIDSLRLEKGYRVWATDIGSDYTPDEAGLGFAVSLKKVADFVGRAAVEQQREAPLTKRLATFTVDDPDAILLGRETIYRNGERVGYLSSGGYGYTVGKSIGLGYVRNAEGVGDDYLRSGDYEIEVRMRRFPAALHMRALYDPESTRIKG